MCEICDRSRVNNEDSSHELAGGGSLAQPSKESLSEAAVARARSRIMERVGLHIAMGGYGRGVRMGEASTPADVAYDVSFFSFPS